MNGLVPLVAIAAATLVCWTISFPRHLQSQAQQLRDGAEGAQASAGGGINRGRGSLAEPLITGADFDPSEHVSLLGGSTPKSPGGASPAV